MYLAGTDIELCKGDTNLPISSKTYCNRVSQPLFERFSTYTGNMPTFFYWSTSFCMCCTKDKTAFI